VSLLQTLFDAEIHIGGATILWREILGNGFGIASAIGGMKRVVWAWPVGIIGNALLFTVFMGALFHTPQDLNLYGQAGRQLLFITVSVYGWTQWLRSRNDSGEAVLPHWASPGQRIAMIVTMVVGTVAFAKVFEMLGSWGPWPDAWIFTGSIRNGRVREGLRDARLVGAVARRLDLHRLDPRHLRDGPRVD
jgi:nicotinamide mononucleotide transporter